MRKLLWFGIGCTVVLLLGYIGYRSYRVWKQRHLVALAREFKLGVTGGSDFHGDVKPNVRLGTGAGNLNIPRSVLDKLRANS